MTSGCSFLDRTILTYLAYEMNLANLFRARGRYTEAEPLYQRNLEAKLRVLGAEHAATLDTMGNFANFSRRPVGSRKQNPFIAGPWTSGCVSG